MTRASRISTAALTALALAISLALSGCSASGNVTMDSSPLLTPGEISREAGLRDTRLCVINNTSMNMRIQWWRYPDKRPIPPAGQSCNTGYAGTEEFPDVTAWIEYEPRPSQGTWNEIRTEASNSFLFAPWANVTFYVEGEKYGICWASFDEGESYFIEDGWVRAEMQRLKDSEDHKEFVLNLGLQQGDYQRQYCGSEK